MSATKSRICKRRVIWLFLALILLPGAEGGAWAQNTAPRPLDEVGLPGQRGMTGLLLLPTAAVQPNHQATLFLGGDHGHGIGGLLLGVGERAEIGVAAGPSDSLRVTAKTNILPETLLAPAVSVGVIASLAAQHDNDASFYLVATKRLPAYFVERFTKRKFAVAVHAGLGGGESFGNRLLLGSVLLGTELFVGENGEVLAELVHGRANIGARVRLGEASSATLGLFGGDGWRLSVSYRLVRR